MLKSKKSNNLELSEYKQPIVFDLFDTLLDESSIYKKFFFQIAKKYRIEITAEEFVNKIFQNQHEFVFANVQKSLKEITKLSYTKLIKQADPNDVELLFDLYSGMKFFPGIIDLLLKLEKNHDLFILTNTDNNMLEKVSISAKSPVRFKKIFTSEDNGTYKPNPKAYQIVVDYIRLPPKKITYVSSNGWDIEKSREFGFNVKLLNDLR
jgi:2-haloalkanoic acid dehalogenase type II